MNVKGPSVYVSLNYHLKKAEGNSYAASDIKQGKSLK